MSKNISKINSQTSSCTLKNASGRIRYKLTNDFMFHVVFEKNIPALRMLLGSLLHMVPEEIKSLEVCNPTDYGSFVTDKKIILDLKLLLNSNKLVNIEMQVLNEKNWPERSLIYLCRSYDNVSKRRKYSTVFSANQVSILDFDLDNTEPEFYSTHHLINDRTGLIFNGNFALSVLNLRRIELATDEDKMWRIDRWARLFKSETWEELRMIAAEDVEMTNVANTLYTINSDEQARLWAQAREDFLLMEATIMEDAENAKKELLEAREETNKAKAEAAKYRDLLLSNGINPDA